MEVWGCKHTHLSFLPRLRSKCHDLWKCLIVQSLHMRVEPLGTYPRSCFWLRVTLHSRTCCWTPPPGTEVSRIEPQRCSWTTGTPRNKEEVTSFSPGVAQKLITAPVGFLGTYCLPSARARTSMKTASSHCFMEVSVLGIVTSTIPYWR